MTPIHMILWAALFVAAALDLQTTRIKNWLTLPLMVFGLAANALAPSGIGLYEAFLGWLFAGVLHLGLFALKLEGAGDGKLMIGVGACLGWKLMVVATLWRYLLLFPYAIGALTLTRRWRNFKDALLWTGFKLMGKPVGERPEPLKLPFGPVLAVAVVLAQTTNWLQGVIGF